ncbi:MAG: biotin/lipoyl-containing protein [Clostridia bacterium]
MKYIVTINQKNYEVLVDKTEAKILNVTDVVAPVALAPTAPVATPTVAAPATTSVANGNVLEAPMPGTILDVKKKVGDKVSKGDVILILEAMKMENDIPAHVDGTILQIVATKGSTVSTGDTLVVIG